MRLRSYPQFDDPELHRKYNLLAIDMPGHGSSHVDSPLTKEYSWQNAADDFFEALVGRCLQVTRLALICASPAGGFNYWPCSSRRLGGRWVDRSEAGALPSRDHWEPDPCCTAFGGWTWVCGESFRWVAQGKPIYSIFRKKTGFDIVIGNRKNHCRQGHWVARAPQHLCLRLLHWSGWWPSSAGDDEWVRTYGTS